MKYTVPAPRLRELITTKKNTCEFHLFIALITFTHIVSYKSNSHKILLEHPYSFLDSLYPRQ